MSHSILTFNPNQSAGKSTMLPITDDIILSLIWCPAGTFMMGSTENDPYTKFDEKPQHRVTLSRGFWIGQFPITCEQWNTLMDNPITWNAPDVPADSTTWHSANEFCTRLTERFQNMGIIQRSHRVSLPTEAQWEYACRAGTSTTWYFGDDPSLLTEHAWYEGNRDKKSKPMPVGTKLCNSWGIYDLYGNVNEWCLDNWLIYKEFDVTDPLLVTDDTFPYGHNLRIVRGGDFISLLESCRSASRWTSGEINPMHDNIGLRIVCVDN